jgi:hypothetical protein
VSLVNCYQGQAMALLGERQISQGGNMPNNEQGGQEVQEGTFLGQSEEKPRNSETTTKGTKTTKRGSKSSEQFIHLF